MGQMRELHKGGFQLGFDEPNQAYTAGKRDAQRLGMATMGHMAVMLSDQPWERVEKVLLLLRPTLALKNAAWMDG